MSTARRFFRTLLFASITLHACGPVTDEMLIKYPRRQIDRPYTQPKGLISWDASFRIEPEEPTVGKLFNIAGLGWTYPVSDGLSLHFFGPIPLASSFQISRDEKSIFGVFAGAGSIGYSSFQGWILGPLVGARYQRKISDDIAVSLCPSFRYTYTEEGRDWASTDLRAGPRWQAFPTLSITSQTGITGWTYLRATASQKQPTRSSGVGYPLELTASWSASRNWDIGATYEVRNLADWSLGEYNFSLRFSRYWGSTKASEPPCGTVECAD